MALYFGCWLDYKKWTNKTNNVNQKNEHGLFCSHADFKGEVCLDGVIICISLMFSVLYKQWCLWVRSEFFCWVLLLKTIRPGALEENRTFSAGIPAQNASCCNGSSSRSSDEREYVSSSPCLPAHGLPPTYSVMSQTRLLKENMILLHNPEIKFTEH